VSRTYVSVSPLLVPVEKRFDYAVPGHLRGEVTLGSLVVVPFGNRKIFALVVKISGTTDVPPEKIRNIEGLVEDFRNAPSDLLSLCIWISKMYMCPLNTVLETAFPFHRKMGKYGIDRKAFRKLQEKTILEKSVTLKDAAFDEAVASDFRSLSKAPVQRRLLRILAREGGSMPARTLTKMASSSMQTVKALEKKGYISVEYLTRAMEPAGPAAAVAEKQHVLTPEQDKAFRGILRAIEPSRHEVFLLHGVTSSGKTEVYMHAVRECLALGRRVIILVPEIALATQIISRFLRRFIGRVAIWHSMLSMTERLYEWKRITSGQIDVVIGARSAVFAPVDNVGLIVVDEEHEAAYKQESAPRYHARETAIRRGKLLGIPVVLGSATPSLESMRQAREESIRYLFLPERMGGSVQPDMAIVDMKKQKTHRTTSTFSPIMVEAIRDNMEKGEQTMVFLNHRGYSQYIQCYRCGVTIECPHCSVTMKYHKGENRVKCHMCGYGEDIPEHCPDCGSRALRYHGVGTERIFNQLRRAFKDARIERMDRDTVSKKGEYQRIIEACEEGEVDILVGTQMIAKGLDFPGVTLVCVVTADSIINMPDFRSAERTYQLLTQVAGRAGRRTDPGRVIVQTFNPQHPAIKAACSHDPQGFYDHELESRREAGYPPFTVMVNFIVTTEEEPEGYRIATALSENLQEEIENTGVRDYFGVLGPASAAFFRLHGKYRYMLNVRSTSIKELLAVCRAAFGRMPEAERKFIAPDVHPQNML